MRNVLVSIKDGQTIEEALQKNGVDLSLWSIQRYEVASWEMGAKVDNEIITRPLHAIRVYLVPNEANAEVQAFKQALLDELRMVGQETYTPPPVPPITDKSPRMALVAIADLHIGKLAWHRETGTNYDSDIAVALGRYAYRTLLERISSHPIEEVVLLMGNDLMHVDNHNNTTSSGTPMDSVDTRWQRSFRLAKDLAIWAVRQYRPLAKVRVVMIPGNHDRERIFYLGEVLEAFFHHDDHVSIQHGPSPRQYYHWRNVLLGFTHGNKEKLKDLPMLMATEQPTPWSKSKYREWLVGHYHAKGEVVRNLQEAMGVRVRIMPSLSATDAWHHENGFVGNNRAAEAYIYHPVYGLETETMVYAPQVSVLKRIKLKSDKP